MINFTIYLSEQASIEISIRYFSREILEKKKKLNELHSYFHNQSQFFYFSFIQKEEKKKKHDL